MRLIDRNRFDPFPFIDFSINLAATRAGFNPNDFVPVVPIPALSKTLWITLSKSSDPALV